MNDNEQQIEYLTGLFQSQYGMIVAAARRYSPLADQIDDIVQQVYVEFVTGALQGKWNMEKNVGPLLFQIAKRRAQNVFREMRKKQNGNIDNLADHLISADIHQNENLEWIEQKIETLHRCLEKLPSESRSVIEQHYFEDVSIKNLARQLRKTPETLHRFFSRIREKLRDCIKTSLNKNND